MQVFAVSEPSPRESRATHTPPEKPGGIKSTVQSARRGILALKSGEFHVNKTRSPHTKKAAINAVKTAAKKT